MVDIMQKMDTKIRIYLYNDQLNCFDSDLIKISEFRKGSFITLVTKDSFHPLLRSLTVPKKIKVVYKNKD